MCGPLVIRSSAGRRVQAFAVRALGHPGTTGTQLLVAMLLGALLLTVSGCTESGSTDGPSSETTSPTGTSAAPTSVRSPPPGIGSDAYQDIEFTSGDTVLPGRLFGVGPVAIVLAHMGRARDSQDDWAAFDVRLADRGYQVLTYDHDNSSVEQDVLGAANYLRDSGPGRWLPPVPASARWLLCTQPSSRTLNSTV